MRAPSAMALVVKPLRRDAAENRERLLSAAAQVFADSGPDAGVEEVARAAGVGMGTLYRRFPTKAALVDELVAELRRELAAVARSALAQPDAVALEHLLRGAGAVMFVHRGCLHQLWHESQVGLELLQEFRDGMAISLARAQQAGIARAELAPSDLSLVLWGIRGVIEMTRSTSPDAWQRHLEITLAGLRPSPQPFGRPALTDQQIRALTAVGRTSITSRLTSRRP